MGNKHEIGVIVNPSAKSAEFYADKINYPPALRQGIKIFTLQEMNDAALTSKRLLIASGDGPAALPFKEQMHLGKIIPIGILPAGTKNVFAGELKRAGAEVCLEEFMDHGRLPKFSPGVMKVVPDENTRISDQEIEVNSVFFVNHIGLGTFELNAGNLGEWRIFRMLPDNYRLSITRLIALGLVPFNFCPAIDMYNLSSTIGNLPAFPDQNILDKQITHGVVKGGLLNLPAFMRVVQCLRNGMIPEDEDMKRKKAKSFNTPDSPESIWVDGTTVPNPNARMPVTYMRVDVEYPVAVVDINAKN